MPAKRPTKKTKRRAKPAKRSSAGSGGPQSGLITRDAPGSNPGPATKLSERERRFVEAYMGEAAGNGYRAAIIAGYAKNSARGQASRLLAKAHIRAAIEGRAKSDELVATREQRQRFWTSVMNGDGNYAFCNMSDRLKASELLGKSQADFIDRSEVEIKTPPSLTLVLQQSAETKKP